LVLEDEGTADASAALDDVDAAARLGNPLTAAKGRFWMGRQVINAFDVVAACVKTNANKTGLIALIMKTSSLFFAGFFCSIRLSSS
jgi:hypothetical protein